MQEAQAERQTKTETQSMKRHVEGRMFGCGPCSTCKVEMKGQSARNKKDDDYWEG